jgi:hypothetical protein
VLRHAWHFAGALIALWALLMMSGMAGWRKPTGLATGIFGLFAAMVVLAVWATRERERLVREAPLPQFLKRKLRDTYPHLSVKDTELVERGLRQFFMACVRSKGKFVAMPSRVVDSMWHEFILHTRAYREWCDLVLGRFMDHVPAEVLGSRAPNNDGLRRAWYWACRDEAIKPRSPSRLPLLFALDAKLAIPNGFHYLPDCSKPQRDDGAGRLQRRLLRRKLFRRQLQRRCGWVWRQRVSSSGDGGGSDGGATVADAVQAAAEAATERGFAAPFGHSDKGRAKKPPEGGLIEKRIAIFSGANCPRVMRAAAIFFLKNRLIPRSCPAAESPRQAPATAAPSVCKCPACRACPRCPDCAWSTAQCGRRRERRVFHLFHAQALRLVSQVG